MSAHPWLVPSAALVAKLRRTRAIAVLRALPAVPARRLGGRAAAWPPLVAALPALLRAEPARLLAAVGRVDVLPALQELVAGRVDDGRLEQALVVLWLAIAGHPGLAASLALPGPFRQRVVDPCAPRLLAFGDARGLAATAGGAVVIGRERRFAIDEFVVAQLPATGETVIVDQQRGAPDAEVAARVRTALASVAEALPGGRLDRVTIGTGDAVCDEARVGPDADPADLVASAEVAFVRAAAALEPVMHAGGVLVDAGRSLTPAEVVARTCGNAVALPWRADRAAAARAIADDLDELAVLAEPTAAGARLVSLLHASAGALATERRRALLVNVDADDFVYSFQFGRSVERRCRERGLWVDRIAVDPQRCGDLAAELGGAMPPPVADGTEILLGSEQDPSLADVLHRLSERRYEVVVANVRPGVFHDLLAGGFLAAPTLLWDRHLHGGLRAEGERRGIPPGRLGALPLRAWSLADQAGDGLQLDLAAAGLRHGSGHVWPLDLVFFRSTARQRADLLFAGGDNGRDWPLLIEAVRDLPFAVHLVTRQPPAVLPAAVHVDTRLTLCRFRDAMAAASVAALPLVPGVAAGVTVLPMAMALGVAVVATRTQWTEQYVTDGEEGLLVPPGDVGAFRDALARLHAQADLRARLGANARRRVASLCDLEAFTREMFATLDGSSTAPPVTAS